MKRALFQLITALLFAGFSAVLAIADEPAATLLWPDGAPGAKGDGDEDKPALFFHPAPKESATGAFVIVCPGGGYRALMMSYEGHDVARYLNAFGVSTAVLRSRIAPKYGHPSPMLDVQRAVRYVRANAKELGIDPNRIGVMGFSAGGHLAGTASVHYDAGKADAEDPVERVSSRPDFSVLVYPVISMMDGVTHSGSRENLLGQDAAPELIEKMSLEKQVTKDTPPVFLFHTSEDKVVDPEHSILFYRAMRKAGAPAELHIYRSGNHGVGLDRNPTTRSWPSLLRDWMHHAHLLKEAE